MKNYKYKKNNNIEDDYQFSSNKEINKHDDNYYLIKYRKIFGNSLTDDELLDIFEKNNYNEKLIMEELKSLGNEKKYDYYNNYNSYEHNNFKSKSRSRGKKNKYEKRPFQKCIEIPSDYAPPPKKEEESNDDKNIGSQNEDQELNTNKKILNKNELSKENNIIDKNDIYKKDILLAYKENLFKKLKNPEYSYKPNKNKNDEINMDNIYKNTNDYDNCTKKIINLNEKNKNIKIENNSPGPQCQPYKKSKISQNINKDLKKKYIRDFFGNMKNYSNNLRRANWDKSPDLRRDNILDTSPDKEAFVDRKILTYKKGAKNYYSNENDFKFNKNKEYKYLKISNKVNNIFISACYDNPQRDQFLRIINEKRKQNPDKVIEFLIPQFPPMFPMTPYQNMYSQYNQYNPYMNMYMMPPQIPVQNPMMSIINNNNNPVQNTNNNSNKKNNNAENNETPDCQNPLTQTQVMQLNNNNQINVKINNTPNPNALLLNNNDMNNSKSNKSSGNVSNSGNSGSNNIDANLHL